MTSLHLDQQPEPEIILRTEAKTLNTTDAPAAPGPEAVANMLLFAVVLYVIGIWMINTCPWYVLPGGIALLGLAFVQMYRVGISCTAVFDGSAIGSAFRKQDRLAKRIVGQLSLLMLLRPLTSLRTKRPDVVPSKVLGSKRLHFLLSKISLAYDFNQQYKDQRKARYARTWCILQFGVVITFGLLFFSWLFIVAGIKGVVTYWLAPFLLMHLQLGSLSYSSKADSRANADRVMSRMSLKRSKATTEVKAVKEVDPEAEPAHWFNIVYLGLMHLGALYGLSLVPFASRSTNAIAFAFFVLSEFGITAGAHRLWAHRTYSAHWSVEIFLTLCCSMANEGSILKWARDHRLHHKHVDTPMDPHNASRGFWYSHIGWLLMRKPKSVMDAGRKVHMEDLTSNRIVMFHHKNYLWMSMLCCFVAPTMLCSAMGGDAFKAFWIAGVLRYVCVLHGTWLVNSLAHLWGTRPYLGNILPCENLIVSIFAMGEGWHNYHHAYPYDYSANEYGWWQWNPTTAALDLFAAVGLVKDRRRASPKAGNVPDSELPQFSMEDVKASVGQAAMLLVLDGYVYDVSTFVGQGLHPGGEKIIKAYMGKDVSETFAKGSKHQHTPVAYNVLKDYKMGILKVTEEKLKEM